MTKVKNECSSSSIEIFFLVLRDFKRESLQKYRLRRIQQSQAIVTQQNSQFAGPKRHPCTLILTVQRKWLALLILAYTVTNFRAPCRDYMPKMSESQTFANVVYYKNQESINSKNVNSCTSRECFSGTLKSLHAIKHRPKN